MEKLEMQVTRSMRKLLIGLAVCSAAFSVQAETKEDMSFSGLMKMSAIDKNKDGMVSKKEFMDMMAKAWDHKAKEMNAKGDRMSKADFDEVLKYLRAGG
jgi:Ca2+-binding EF-hand superfamily protein